MTDKLDLITIQERINKGITELRGAWSELRLRASDKSKASGEYDRAVSLVLFKLKNGVEFTFEGEKIVNPPASYTEKIAKGICYAEKIRLEETEAYYRNAQIVIDSIKCEINALQSLLRYLDS